MLTNIPSCSPAVTGTHGPHTSHICIYRRPQYDNIHIYMHEGITRWVGGRVPSYHQDPHHALHTKARLVARAFVQGRQVELDGRTEPDPLPPPFRRSDDAWTRVWATAGASGTARRGSAAVVYGFLYEDHHPVLEPPPWPTPCPYIAYIYTRIHICIYAHVYMIYTVRRQGGGGVR